MLYYIVVYVAPGCPPLFWGVADSPVALPAIKEDYLAGWYVYNETTKEIHDRLKQSMAMSLS